MKTNNSLILFRNFKNNLVYTPKKFLNLIDEFRA